MKIISEENYLKHYGVLGMHWGKRKARGHEGEATNKSNERIESNGKKGKSLAEGLLNSAVGVVVVRAAGGHLVNKGHVEAGAMLAKYGTLYFAGDAIGKTVVAGLEKKAAKKSTHKDEKIKDLPSHKVDAPSKKSNLADRVNEQRARRNGNDDEARRNRINGLLDVSPTTMMRQARILEAQGKTDEARRLRNQAMAKEIFRS